MPCSTETDVFVYMKSQNRPYSASDIFLNLHKKHGKTAVVKALESLAEQGKLLEKVYGKSKIYVVHQSQFPEVGDVELKKLDGEISEVTKVLEELQSRLASATSECKTLAASLTTTDALAKVKSLTVENKQLEERLEGLRSDAPLIDPAEKKQIFEKHKTNVTYWRKRKRMTTDLMNAVLEGYPKSKKHFLDEVGLETDEDCGVTIPQT